MTQKRVNRGRESYIFGTFLTFFGVLGVKKGGGGQKGPGGQIGGYIGGRTGIGYGEGV